MGSASETGDPMRGSGFSSVDQTILSRRMHRHVGEVLRKWHRHRHRHRHRQRELRPTSWTIASR